MNFDIEFLTKVYKYDAKNDLVDNYVNSTMEEKCEILNKIYGFGYIRPFWGVVNAAFRHFQMDLKIKSHKNTVLSSPPIHTAHQKFGDKIVIAKFLFKV